MTPPTVPPPLPSGGGVVQGLGGDLDSPAEAKARPPSPDALAVLAYWVQAMGKRGPAAKTTTTSAKGRLAKVTARLTEGYTLADLKLAVDGCASNAFLRQNGHEDLTLICRDGAHVEAFMAQARGGPPVASQTAALPDGQPRPYRPRPGATFTGDGIAARFAAMPCPGDVEPDPEMEEPVRG